MRLYEVIDVAKEALGGASVVLNDTVYRPTEEHFRSEQAFKNAIKADGKKYSGKSWILLPDRKVAVVMTIKRSEQYEIDLGGKQEEPVSDNS